MVVAWWFGCGWVAASCDDPLPGGQDAAIIKREKAANAPEKPKFKDLELRRILGVGTFGRVKLVIHKPTGVSYALKCMRKAQVPRVRHCMHCCVCMQRACNVHAHSAAHTAPCIVRVVAIHKRIASHSIPPHRVPSHPIPPHPVPCAGGGHQAAVSHPE